MKNLHGGDRFLVEQRLLIKPVPLISIFTIIQ